MARYRVLALAAVAATGLVGAGALALLAAGGLAGPTLVALAIPAAFVVVLAGTGLRSARRTSTPYW